MKVLLSIILLSISISTLASRASKQVRTLSCKAKSFSWIYVTTRDAHFAYFDKKSNSILKHVQPLKGLKMSKVTDAITGETVIYDSTVIEGFQIRITRPKSKKGTYVGKMSMAFDSGNELVRKDSTGTSMSISEYSDLDIECEQIN